MSSDILRLSDNERLFYETMAVREKWGKRAISTNLVYRILKNKENINEIGIVTIPESPKDIISDPYVVEFLGFKAFPDGKESEIEDAIINNLEKFLMELGRGFSFYDRQFSINMSGKVYRADLVFYNIPLKRYVIFEIKSREAQHKDIGQLQMYVNYFDREICGEGENSTLGVLLCKEKDQTMIDYTLPEDNQTIFTSELKLYLPTKEELLKVLEDSESND